MPTTPLTIGELFPSDDIVGQWIVSMSLLNDDLVFITEQLKTATDAGDLRGMLYLQRQWILRLYEAHRLVRAADAPEVAAFIGDNPPQWLEALRQRYLPPRATLRATAAGVASIRPRVTSPVSVSNASKVICARCTSNPATIAIRGLLRVPASRYRANDLAPSRRGPSSCHLCAVSDSAGLIASAPGSARGLRS
jgi:hypothetical protein